MSSPAGPAVGPQAVLEPVDEREERGGDESCRDPDCRGEEDEAQIGAAGRRRFRPRLLHMPTLFEGVREKSNREPVGSQPAALTLSYGGVISSSACRNAARWPSENNT